MITIRKAGLAVIKDKKVMLARSKKNAEVFYMLGGKYEPGETDEECLKREVAEEVGCTIKPGSLRFLHEFEAPAHGDTPRYLIERVYIGELIGEPTPQSEIAEIRYFDSTV
ncbi:MAG TPA: NUDIX domain-containing protein [Candidatus Saccharimonadales bacterium]